MAKKTKTNLKSSQTEIDWGAVVESGFQYAEDVRNEKILACRYLKKAVERFYKDQERKDLFLDHQKIRKAVEFYKFIKHTKGSQFAGSVFIPSPWQVFAIINLYGWYWTDTKKRRFRRAYLKVPRKNGKSTFMSASAVYALSCDGEAVPEVYSAATMRSQAKIVFDEAVRMIKKSPSLNRFFKCLTWVVTPKKGGGKFEPLGADGDNLDGLNISFGVIDEYHAHKTKVMYDVLDTADGARENPQIFTITTAGRNTESPCFYYEQELKAVLDGVYNDDNTFILIYELDREDLDTEEIDGKTRYKWENPDIWIKSNPNLDVSVSKDYLLQKLPAALRSKANRVNFLTKHMDMWVSAPTTWIETEIWNKNNEEIDEAELVGLSCYGGLDLATRDDFCTFSLVFDHNGKVVIKSWSWCPSDTVEDRISKGLSALGDWMDKGLVFETIGNVTSYSEIEAFIVEKAKLYDIKSIGYDPYNATSLVENLTDAGIVMNQYTQGKDMIIPTKSFYYLALEGGFNHLDNPVLRWALSNVVIVHDKNENFWIHKGNSTKLGGKVDPIVATVIALGEKLEEKGETEINIWGFD